jgi:outer membrane protein insertion porin family
MTGIKTVRAGACAGGHDAVGRPRHGAGRARDARRDDDTGGGTRRYARAAADHQDAAGRGAQRIEPETVLSYTKLRVGIPYSAETLDQALKDLQASELFADYSISGVESGDIVLRVREPDHQPGHSGGQQAPEGRQDQEGDQARAALIFTRTAVRQDVARIVELYRRQGRFGAVVDPKMVNLDQNRVDVVFEISEGPKSKVRQINIIGNENSPTMSCAVRCTQAVALVPLPVLGHQL